jgi:hypothetical protein
MLVTIPQVGVQQAGLSSVNLAQVAIGPITVGDLVLTNTSPAMEFRSRGARKTD